MRAGRDEPAALPRAENGSLPPFRFSKGQTGLHFLILHVIPRYGDERRREE